MEKNPDKILHFSKYEGAGNNFIFVNNTSNKYPFLTDNGSLIRRLCDYNFGIGCNCMLELLPSPAGYDYYMNVYDRDGERGDMCGNGSRCAAIFAYKENIVSKLEFRFEACDGPHTARIIEKNPVKGLVEVRMKDVDEVKIVNDTDYFINNGNQHYVRFVQGLNDYPILSQGRIIRDLEEYKDVGTANANFAEWIASDDNGVVGRKLHLRTYERKNLAEILACGTGAVAGALVAYWRGWQSVQNQPALEEQLMLCYYTSKEDSVLTTEVVMPGGSLWVSFRVDEECKFRDVWLRGPANEVYTGQLLVE